LERWIKIFSVTEGAKIWDGDVSIQTFSPRAVDGTLGILEGVLSIHQFEFLEFGRIALENQTLSPIGRNYNKVGKIIGDVEVEVLDVI